MRWVSAEPPIWHSDISYHVYVIVWFYVEHWRLVERVKAFYLQHVSLSSQEFDYCKPDGIWPYWLPDCQYPHFCQILSVSWVPSELQSFRTLNPMHEENYVDMRVFFDPKESSGKLLFHDDLGYDVLTILPELISNSFGLYVAYGF